MEDKIQLYTSSQEEAKKYDEVDLWRESYKENVRCARAIEEATRDNFDGKTLRQNCAESIIEEFGFARVNFVLANTLREKNWDIRFSEDNFQCAKSIYVPREDTSWMFAVESLPAVVNGFCDQVRKAWQELGLYDQSHCVDTQGEQCDYRDKIVILRGEYFKDEFKAPENQLFLAESGFGCSPNARGQKVYGVFLHDLENACIQRSDIMGVAKDTCLPEWVHAQLELLNKEMKVETPKQCQQQMM